MASTTCWHCHQLAQMVLPYNEDKGYVATAVNDELAFFPDVRFGEVENSDVLLKIYSCVNCGYPNIALVRAPEDKYGPFDSDHDVIDWLPVMPMGKDYPDVPESVASAASEAHKCFEIQAYRAAVMLSRSTLEGIASEQEENPSDEPLYERIQNLAESGKIKQRTADAATEIRLSGNLATHDTNFEVDSNFASIIVEILDSVIDDLYTNPSLVEKVKTYVEQQNSQKD